MPVAVDAFIQERMNAMLITRTKKPIQVLDSDSEEKSVFRKTSHSRRDTMKKRTQLLAQNKSNHLEYEAQVLYQRIFDKWYAFSVIDEDCFMTPISDDEIQKKLIQTRKTLKAA